MKMRVYNECFGSTTDRVFNVFWEHTQKMEVGERSYFRGLTRCTIMEGAHPEDYEVAFSIALCSVKDTFCKESGRKVSFTRALNELFPNNKGARTKMWKQYFDRKTK